MTVSEELLYENAPKARDLWLGTMPQKADVPEHTFSEQFEKKMGRLLRRPHRAVSLNTFRRAVAVAIIIAAIIFTAVMTVNAVFRERVIEVVVRVFNEFTEYRFVLHEPETDQYEYPELTAVEFGYVPEGFIETEYNRGDYYEHIRYESDDGSIFELEHDVVQPGESFQMILDTENSDYGTFYMEGKEAYSNVKNGDSMIIWVDGNSVYHLRSNLPLEELKKIASKIK